MTIDGVNILTTYGLRVLKVNDLHNLPQRKTTTAIMGNEAKDIVHQPLEVAVQLFAVFGDIATHITVLKAFETLIKSACKHEVLIPERGHSFTGVAANGFTTKNYLKQRVTIIDITFTVDAV